MGRLRGRRGHRQLPASTAVGPAHDGPDAGPAGLLREGPHEEHAMIRVGLIGCGRIGRVHADSIDVPPHAQLAHVYDPFEAAAREVGTRFGAAWGTDVDAVLDDATI